MAVVKAYIKEEAALEPDRLVLPEVIPDVRLVEEALAVVNVHREVPDQEEAAALES